MEEETSPARHQTCCQNLRSCVTLSPKGTTPINYKVMGLCVLALFSSCFTITFLFPFLPEMVLSFGYAEEEKGYYAGMIASSMFAGRAFGSYFWGWLSDRKGRRPILIITVVANGIFALAFGFSRNLTMALLFRFLSGLSNGSVGTAKTILYEICDNSNQAVGMSALSLAWGGGIVIGPAIGGYLASPTKKYPSAFSADGFFGTFPYVLPSIVSFVIAVITVCVLIWKLPETLEKRDQEIAIEVDTSDEAHAVIPLDEVETCLEKTNTEMEPANNPNRHTDFRQFLSLESLECDTRLDPYSCNVLSPDSAHRIANGQAVRHRESPDGLREVTVDVIGSCISLPDPSSISHKLSVAYMAVSPLSVNKEQKMSMSENVLSKHAAMTIPQSNTGCNGFHGNKNMPHAKYAVDTSLCVGEDADVCETLITDLKVGTLEEQSCCQKLLISLKRSSIVRLLSQSDVRRTILLYTFYSFAVIGYEDVFTIWASTDPYFDGLGFSTDQIGMAVGVVSIPLLCLQIFLFPGLAKRLGLIKTYWICGIIVLSCVLATPMLHLIYDRPKWLWVGLLVTLIPERMAANCCFAATALFINNSVRPETAGELNGIAMTFTAAARTLAPAMGGSLFAWSISYGTFHIGAPFDVNLVFLLFSLVFWFTTLYSVFMPEHLNRQRK